eukprot:NODE_45_length_32908_cov_0.790271.p13 type:complete len:286 gc:universal NODE_45_length_32908_cov_0.790271:25333-26190(+)
MFYMILQPISASIQCGLIDGKRTVKCPAGYACSSKNICTKLTTPMREPDCIREFSLTGTCRKKLCDNSGKSEYTCPDKYQCEIFHNGRFGICKEDVPPQGDPQYCYNKKSGSRTCTDDEYCDKGNYANVKKDLRFLDGLCFKQECGVKNGKVLQCVDPDKPNCFLSAFQKKLGNDKGYCLPGGDDEYYPCDGKYSYNGACEHKTPPLFTPTQSQQDSIRKNCEKENPDYGTCGLYSDCDGSDFILPMSCLHDSYCNFYSDIMGNCDSVPNNNGTCESNFGKDCPE